MVQYRITEDDYASAVRLHVWRRFIAPPSIIALVVGVVVMILLGFALWTRPSFLTTIVFTVVVFAFIFAGALFVRVPSRARQYYRQYKGIEEPITLELMDAGVKFINADGGGMLPWSKIFQWRQNDRFILIYRMPILFHIVPKSIAGQGFDVALLVQRLVEHVGPER